MEIKRKIEICVRTERRFTVRQSEIAERIICADCAGQMLAAEQAAAVCGISRRRIYQLVEQAAMNFIETEAGVLLVCPNSLIKILEENI